MKIYVNSKGQVVDVADSTFVANSTANIIRFYFVDDDGNVIDLPEINLCNISVKRSDGLVVANLMAVKNVAEHYWEYVITETDGVLYRKGALEVSAQLAKVTYDTTAPEYSAVVATAATTGTLYSRSGNVGSYTYTAISSGFTVGATYYARHYPIKKRDVIATIVATAHVAYNIGEADADELELALENARLDRDALQGQITRNKTVLGFADTYDVATEKTVEERLDRHDQLITDDEADIAALDGRLTTAEADIDALELRATTAESGISYLTPKVTSIENNMAIIEEDFNAFDEVITNQNELISEMDEKTTAVVASVGDMANVAPIADNLALAIKSLNEDVDSLQLGVKPRIIRGVVLWPTPETLDTDLIAELNAKVLESTSRAQPDNTDSVQVWDNAMPDAGKIYTYHYWSSEVIGSELDGWYLASIYMSPAITEIPSYVLNIISSTWTAEADTNGLYYISVEAITHGMGSDMSLYVDLRRKTADGDFISCNQFWVSENGTVVCYTDEKFEGKLIVRVGKAYYTTNTTNIVSIEMEQVNGLNNALDEKITADGGEAGDTIATFADVEGTAENISSGNTIKSNFGKIKNWLGRLKALAFKDSISDADIASDAAIAQSKISGLTDALNAKVTATDGEAGACVSAITEDTADEITNLTGGDTIKVHFGKIKRWLAALKALAFKDTISNADIASNAAIAQSKISGLTDALNGKIGASFFTDGSSSPSSGGLDLGGGFQLRWGICNIAAGEEIGSATFIEPFTTRCMSASLTQFAIASAVNIAEGVYTRLADSVSKTSLQISISTAQESSISFYYIAVGF